MPKFDKKNNGNGNGDGKPPVTRPTTGEVVEERCHVCQSPYRRAIDRMIALGTSYTDISRFFDDSIDRRSISRHSKKHLNYEDAAIQRIIESETQLAEQAVEDGIKGAVARKVFLESYVQKARESLLSGDMELTGKDAMSAIQMLTAFESQSSGAQLAKYETQFSAFMEAMREICSFEQQQQILERVKEILKLPEQSQIEPGA